MKIYKQNDKLIIDASARAYTNLTLFAAAAVLYTVLIINYSKHAGDNVLTIVICTVLFILVILRLLFGDKLLIRTTIGPDGISESRISFRKQKRISWNELEDYYFYEYSPFKGGWPKYRKAVFTSNDADAPRQLRTPYYNVRYKDEYERQISEFCDEHRK